MSIDDPNMATVVQLRFNTDTCERGVGVVFYLSPHNVTKRDLGYIEVFLSYRCAGLGIAIAVLRFHG